MTNTNPWPDCPPNRGPRPHWLCQKSAASVKRPTARNKSPNGTAATNVRNEMIPAGFHTAVSHWYKTGFADGFARDASEQRTSAATVTRRAPSRVVSEFRYQRRSRVTTTIAAEASFGTSTAKVTVATAVRSSAQLVFIGGKKGAAIGALSGRRSLLVDYTCATETVNTNRNF